MKSFAFYTQTLYSIVTFIVLSLVWFGLIEMSVTKLLCTIGIYLVGSVTYLATWFQHIENKINEKNRLG